MSLFIRPCDDLRYQSGQNQEAPCPDERGRTSGIECPVRSASYVLLLPAQERMQEMNLISDPVCEQNDTELAAQPSVEDGRPTTSSVPPTQDTTGNSPHMWSAMIQEMRELRNVITSLSTGLRPLGASREESNDRPARVLVRVTRDPKTADGGGVTVATSCRHSDEGGSVHVDIVFEIRMTHDRLLYVYVTVYCVSG